MYINKKEFFMNIQIFGTRKSFDTKKAERYFKERSIKYQFIDMKEKGLSKGEFNSVCQAVGGFEALIDESSKDKDLLALIKYISAEDKAEKILENQITAEIVTIALTCSENCRNYHEYRQKYGSLHGCSRNEH